MSSQALPSAKHRADVAAGGQSPQDIEREMGATRERLAGTVDQLLYRVHPKTIVRRQIEDIKARFVDEQGNPRMETILPVAGAAVGVVVFFVVVRRISNRHR